MRPRKDQTQRTMMSLDNATTSARKDGLELDLLGPANPTELVGSSGAKRLISTTSYKL